MKVLYECFLVIVVCVSCVDKRNSVVQGGFITIDISANYPSEDIHIQDIADIEYIPLAISDEVLLAPNDRIFYVSDTYIMILSLKRDEIYIFNRMGEVVSRINRVGRGPGEYESIREIAFDEGAKEFFIVDWFSHSILVYSLSGKYKRTMSLPKRWEIEEMYDFGEETLLVYDGDSMDSGETNPTPYLLISKNDASITDTIDIEMIERYSSVYYWTLPEENGQLKQGALEIRLTNNRLYGDDFLLADKSSDTVYHFSQGRILSPAFIREPSVHASEPRVVWGMELITNDFVVFEVQTLDFEKARNGYYPSIRSLKYEYATKQITEVKFVDDNNVSSNWSNYGKNKAKLPSNTAVQLLDPVRLKDAEANGELRGNLAKIALAMKEDDNPIVMIVKFK